MHRLADVSSAKQAAQEALTAKDYKRARSILEAAAANAPADRSLRLLLATAQKATGDFAAMQTNIASLMAEGARSPELLTLAAEAAWGLGQELMAVAYLTQALQRQKDYVPGLSLRGRLLGFMGQWQEALSDGEALRNTEAGRTEGWLLSGDALAALGKGEDAEAAYHKALALSPHHREAILHLGIFHENRQEWQKALACYDKAIADMPDFAQAFKRRGGVRVRLHDEKGAMEDLQKALSLSPETASEINGLFSNRRNETHERYVSRRPDLA